MRFNPKTFITIICSFVFSMHAFPQPENVFIRIDTIQTHDETETLLNFKMLVGNQGFLNFGDAYDSTANFSFHQYPNYSNVLIIDSEQSEIHIPLDLDGSIIRLKGVYPMDSLQINQITIYKTQSPDTSFTVISKYKKINGKLQEKPFSIKKSLSTKKLKSPPQKIHCTINGTEYCCPLLLKRSPGKLITHGHGNKPKNMFKKDGGYKKKITHIYIDRETIRYYWEGVIDLQE